MVALHLEEEEEEENVIQLHGVSSNRTSPFEFYFVGCFVVVTVIHFPALRTTLANLWHPLGGIQINDLGEKRFLFRFFNSVVFD